MRLGGVLLAYATGLGCAPFLPDHPLLPLLPFLSALFWLPCRRRSWSAVPLALLFFCLGIAFYQLAAATPRDSGHVRAFIGEHPLTVEGTVLEVSARPLERTSIDLQADRVGTEGIFTPVRGRIRLHLDDSGNGIVPGARIRFTARLRPPRLFGTPGEFDYPRHLASRGIFVTAYLGSTQEIVNFGTEGSAHLEGMRASIARFIDTRIAPAAAPLVKALVVGDKGTVTPQQRDILARGGVSHLFAISGLHLGLIALFLYAAALALYRRSETLLLTCPPQRLLPLPLLPLLLAYLLLTGNALSTRRAFLMAAAGGLLIARRRRAAPLRIVAAIAFLILLSEPLALFEPAFQLSFAGAVGILLLLPRWQRRLAAWPAPLRWPSSVMLTTTAATLATAPIVLAHFHILAPAGLLTNLFAVPAVGLLAVPAGLSGALLLPVWPDGAATLLQTCAVIVNWVLSGVEWLVALPFLGGWKTYLPPFSLLGTALLCAVPFLAGGSRRVWFARLALMASAAALLLYPPGHPPGLSVTAISVGQGEALLVSMPDGRHYLVDGGGLPGTTFDVGERLLAPALGRLGVRNLEAVVLSHDHPDHRQGLLHILEHFPVAAFWTAEEPEILDPQLAAVLRQRQIALHTFPPGWTDLGSDADSALALFAPPASNNPNDHSLVLYARHGGDGVLLTGDMEASGVSELLRSPPPGPVTLLKLPHHGSRRSAPQLLLENLKPQLAFVSLGIGNPYHFPHGEVLAELEQRGIPLYRTDRMGSLRFLASGKGWCSKAWQRGLFR